jgi:hypothetical protein
LYLFRISCFELRVYFMKGPSERVKYDLRRLWECPACKRRERTSFTVTFHHCGCQMKQLDGRQVVMKLVTDGVQRVGPPLRVPAAAIESVSEPIPVAIDASSNEPETDAAALSPESLPAEPRANASNGEG